MIVGSFMGSSGYHNFWFLQHATVSQLRSAAYVENVAGNETCLLRQEKHTRVSNDAAVRAIPQWVDFIEIALDGTGVRLLGAPLTQHRSPCTRGAYGVDANTLPCIIKGH